MSYIDQPSSSQYLSEEATAETLDPNHIENKTYYKGPHKTNVNEILQTTSNLNAAFSELAWADARQNGRKAFDCAGDIVNESLPSWPPKEKRLWGHTYPTQTKRGETIIGYENAKIPETSEGMPFMMGATIDINRGEQYPLFNRFANTNVPRGNNAEAVEYDLALDVADKIIQSEALHSTFYAPPGGPNALNVAPYGCNENVQEISVPSNGLAMCQVPPINRPFASPTGAPLVGQNNQYMPSNKRLANLLAQCDNNDNAYALSFNSGELYSPPKDALQKKSDLIYGMPQKKSHLQCNDCANCVKHKQFVDHVDSVYCSCSCHEADCDRDNAIDDDSGNEKKDSKYGRRGNYQHSGGRNNYRRPSGNYYHNGGRNYYRRPVVYYDTTYYPGNLNFVAYDYPIATEAPYQCFSNACLGAAYDLQHWNAVRQTYPEECQTCGDTFTFIMTKDDRKKYLTGLGFILLFIILIIVATAIIYRNNSSSKK